MACPLSSRGTCSPDFPDFPAQAYSLLTLALPLASADQWRPPISNLEQYGGASMKRCARLLEDFLYDLCFGLRQLLRNPLVSGVCVLTLALGIGANAAIFSAAHAVLLCPLPFKNADNLVDLTEYKSRGVGSGGVSYPRLSGLERAKHRI